MVRSGYILRVEPRGFTDCKCGVGGKKGEGWCTNLSWGTKRINLPFIEMSKLKKKVWEDNKSLVYDMLNFRTCCFQKLFLKLPFLFVCLFITYCRRVSAETREIIKWKLTHLMWNPILLRSFDSEEDGSQDLLPPFPQPFPQPQENGVLLTGEID